MKAEESLELATLAFKAIETASPVPLDVVLILSDREDVGASSQLLATLPQTKGDQMRAMLQHYCSALALIVEQADDPETLITEIADVLRRDVLGEKA